MTCDECVGLTVGAVGRVVGMAVGREVAGTVGLADGSSVLGPEVTDTVGLGDGRAIGVLVRIAVGATVAIETGDWEGAVLGDAVGVSHTPKCTFPLPTATMRCPELSELMPLQ